MKKVAKDRPAIAGQWIQALMYLADVGLINAAADIIPFMPWEASYYISMGIRFSVVVCLFQLASVHRFYRISSILKLVVFLCSVLTAFMKEAAILTFAAALSSMIAVFLEYRAHADLIKEKDAKFARKWMKLFLWGIASGVLLSLGSAVSVDLLSCFETDAARITSVIVGILEIPQFIVQFMYVAYLNKMTGLICE